MKTELDKVKHFWENNPLWSGESEFESGTKEFFEEHRQIYYEDCFAGRFDPRFLPASGSSPKKDVSILDLGCGIGFWTVEFGLKGYLNITAADLTENALELTRRRCDLYNIKVELSQQNAEELTFLDESFDHVNCQGVIHHTPKTESAIKEIARVLKPGATASISVYYNNFILKTWPKLSWIGVLLNKLGGGMKGRGRNGIFKIKNVEEIVRLYDGIDNPIGKSYSRKQFIDMLSPHFEVRETFLHFFPARALPIKIPNRIHRKLDKDLGFLIYATLMKI
jgi:2-polyprenyl-3-methyl-5-hydroxy-6-metoxy-1,4-benzoquinol methylase